MSNREKEKEGKKKMRKKRKEWRNIIERYRVEEEEGEER